MPDWVEIVNTSLPGTPPAKVTQTAFDKVHKGKGFKILAKGDLDEKTGRVPTKGGNK